MGAFGALQAMSKTLEQNRALLKKNSVFDKFKDTSYGPKSTAVWEFKKADPALILQISEKMQKARKSEVRTKISILIISFILGIGVMWLGLQFLLHA